MSKQKVSFSKYNRAEEKMEVRRSLIDVNGRTLVFQIMPRQEKIESNEGYVLRNEPLQLRLDYREDSIQGKGGLF